MMSGEVSATWLTVGERTFHRCELYGEAWSRAAKGADRLVAAPFGGPLLATKDQFVFVHNAAGEEVAAWKWTQGKVVSVGWSNVEEAIFVTEDGTVHVHDAFGTHVKTFTMGKEAKDLKVSAAKIFRSASGTSGVAILTGSKRFFVVNSIADPRVRKMPDAELASGGTNLVWAVLSDERHAKIVIARPDKGDVIVLTSAGQADTVLLPLDALDDKVVDLATFEDKIAIAFASGRVWLGTSSAKLASASLDLPPDRMAWCADDAVVAFNTAASRCSILTAQGSREDVFLPDFVTVVQEVDGAKIFSLSGQEMVQEVPRELLRTFSIGSVSPASMLRFAAEEYSRKSHKADDYLREVKEHLDSAVATCIRCAGFVHDPAMQKELLRAAQFGKSFLLSSTANRGSSSSADAFTEMCVTLRILNSLRGYKVGLPLTIQQYSYLTPKVVLDRVLNRRLYPLALEMCKLLKFSKAEGENRVLGHWACYKVSACQDDASVARLIRDRLGNHPQQLSYADIASKAAKSGKRELAVKLLEHEARVSRQVPLLVQLGQESAALTRSLASGDRDLAYSVLLHLRAKLSSSDFHILVRKYPLGRLLFESYCENYDPEALEDWHVQEDNFEELAAKSFAAAHETPRTESRISRLHTAAENWNKAKKETKQAFAEEELKLLKQQSMYEDKLGQTFVGLTANETLAQLLTSDQLKLAEKLKSELKISDRRFAWFRAKALAKRGQWQELKKFMKVKKCPLTAGQIVRLVRDHGGDSVAKEFLTEDLVTSSAERVDLLAELGLMMEAANAAFTAKSLDSLNALETLCVGREDTLRVIANFKTRLLSK